MRYVPHPPPDDALADPGRWRLLRRLLPELQPTGGMNYGNSFQKEERQATGVPGSGCGQHLSHRSGQHGEGLWRPWQTRHVIGSAPQRLIFSSQGILSHVFESRTIPWWPRIPDSECGRGSAPVFSWLACGDYDIDDDLKNKLQPTGASTMTRPDSYSRPTPVQQPSSCRKTLTPPASCAVCGVQQRQMHDPLSRRGRYCSAHCPNCQTPAKAGRST